MDIGKYIAQALKIHAAVYVEQLGVFSKVHRSSTYDRDRQVYLPPLDYIEFDSLEQNGFPLHVFIQQSNNISKTEAESLVQHAVENLRTRAEEDGEIYLDTLGYLIQYGNALVFKAQDLTGFSLEPIPYIQEDDTVAEDVVEEDVSLPKSEDPGAVVDEIPAILPSEEDKQVEEVVPVEDLIDESVHQADGEDNEVSAPDTDELLPSETPKGSHIVAEVPEEIKEVEPVGIFNAEEAVPKQQEEVVEAQSKGRGVWYALLALLMVGIIGGVLWYYYQEKPADTGTTSQEDNYLTERSPIVSEDTSVVDKDTVEGFIASNDTTGQLSAVTGATGSQRQDDAVIPANHSWYIVIGAHRSYAQAEDEVENYQRKGYAHVRMLPKNQSDAYIRVIWDSYVNKHEADSALRYVQKNHVSDAWHRQMKK